MSALRLVDPARSAAESSESKHSLSAARQITLSPRNGAVNAEKQKNKPCPATPGTTEISRKRGSKPPTRKTEFQPHVATVVPRRGKASVLDKPFPRALALQRKPVASTVFEIRSNKKQITNSHCRVYNTATRGIQHRRQTSHDQRRRCRSSEMASVIRGCQSSGEWWCRPTTSMRERGRGDGRAASSKWSANWARRGLRHGGEHIRRG